MNKKSRSHAKRAVRIRLTLTYTLMIMSVTLLVGALYLFIQGYRYNRFENQLEQGGLVQFNSYPSDAAIWLGDSQLGVRTQSRLTISAGSHTISMRKDGYYDWTKQVLVQPGGVLWLNYVRLLPKQPVISSEYTFSQVSSHAASYDGKKIALIADATSPAVQIVSTDADTPQKTTVTLPAGLYTQPTGSDTQSFKLVAWAHDNRYVLLQHTYGSATEWLSVDTASAGVVKNITQLLGVAAQNVVYSRDDANTVFVRDASNDVRRINVDQKTMSAPLIKNVESFDVYDGSTLTYVSKPDSTSGKLSVGYLTLSASSPRVVAQYDAASAGKVVFAIGTYDGTHYLIIAEGESVKVLTGDLPVSDASRPSAFKSYGSFSVPGGVQYIGFSPDGQRFAYMQGGTAIATIDFDTELTAHHTFVSPQTERVSWLDKYHFTAVILGGLGVYDFDGTNSHTILANTPGALAVLSQSGKYMYALQTISAGVQLAKIAMTVN